MKQKAALFVSVKVMQRLRYCAFEGAGPEVWTQELISRLASVAVYHWRPFQTRVAVYHWGPFQTCAIQSQ